MTGTFIDYIPARQPTGCRSSTSSLTIALYFQFKAMIFWPNFYNRI